MSKPSIESEEPLLSRDEDHIRCSCHGTRRASTLTKVASTISVALLLYIGAAVTYLLATRNHFSGPERPYSPANPVLKYETKSTWGGHSKFMGPPSPEVDEAWRDLLLGLNVRGTQEELTLGGENLTNIAQLVDGDYVVVPHVYHQIHCLDYMRKANYIDYYRKNMSPDDDTSLSDGHFDHCLENLRKAVMCHADMGMLTGEWVENSSEHEHIRLRTNSMSTCANWDAIDKWAKGRMLKRGEYAIRAGPFEHELAK